MKLVLFATLAALALLAVPASDVSPVGSARANVCDVDDVECHEQKVRCHVEPLLEGEIRACPR